jgi:hypothetical protein
MAESYDELKRETDKIKAERERQENSYCIERID